MFFPGAVRAAPGAMEGDVTWALEAQYLLVNETWSSRYELPHQHRPTSNMASVHKGPPQYREAKFEDASATSFNRNEDSNLLVLPAQDQTTTATLKAERLAAKATGDRYWAAGSAADADLASRNDTTIVHELPAKGIQAALSDSHMTLQGSFTIFVWEAAVNVSADSERKGYDSGSTVRTPYPTAPGERAVVRERDLVLLKLVATNATLRLAASSEALQVVATRLETQSKAGSLELRGSTGTIQTSEERLHVLDAPLEANGEFYLQIAQAPSDRTRLSGTLDIHQGNLVLTVAGQTLHIERPSDRGAPSLLILTAAAPVAAGFWLFARRKKAHIEDVELALFEGRHRRGRRLAYKLVRRNPKDADALFLYGASFLAQGQTKSLIAKVEPRAAGIARQHRAGVAFLLAVAARTQGDRARVRRWGQEAATNPLILEQLRAQGIILSPQPKLTLDAAYA